MMKDCLYNVSNPFRITVGASIMALMMTCDIFLICFWVVFSLPSE